MSRKANRSATPAPARATAANPAGYVACALAGVVVGGIGMYFLLHEDPALRQPAGPASASAIASAPVSNEMPSFAGMPPAQRAVQQGNWLYDHQRWNEAIASYEEAMKLGADNPDVRTDLGNAYRFINQPMRALELYQAAQRQDPQHENSLLNTATLYQLVLQDTVKAREIFEQFARRFPNSASIGQVRTALAQSAPPNAAAAGAAKPGGTTALLPGPTPAPVAAPAAGAAAPGGAELRSWLEKKTEPTKAP